MRLETGAEVRKPDRGVLKQGRGDLNETGSALAYQNKRGVSSLRKLYGPNLKPVYFLSVKALNSHKTFTVP